MGELQVSCDSTFSICTFCLLFIWTTVEGNYQLIVPSEPIIAAPGDDVVLPCRVDPDWNALEKTVEWFRADLRASGPQKRVEYVYVHRFRKMDRDMMMETYIQRTSLSEGLRHGDVSLRIHNVSLEDTGRFRCFIPNLSIEAEVLLVVDPDFVQITTAETVPQRTSPAPEEETIRTGGRSRMMLFSFISIIIFFIVSLSSVFVCKFKKNKKIQKSPMFQASTKNIFCLAQGQTCIDINGSSMKSSLLQLPQDSDSTRQQNPADGHSPRDQSESYR